MYGICIEINCEYITCGQEGQRIALEYMEGMLPLGKILFRLEDDGNNFLIFQFLSF